MPENEDAWELWLEVATQWRSTGFSILGLDYASLYRETERLQIAPTTRTIRKIKALEALCLEEARHDRDDGGRGGQPGQVA
jgi:hypothetical protein